MSAQDSFRSLIERLTTSAGVKTVYGEPITVEGRTIVPAARVAYGFGGGSGYKDADRETEGKSNVGGGAGLAASPVGVVEITQAGTRFISFVDRKQVAAAAGIGFLLGVWFARRRGPGRGWRRDRDA